MRIVVTGASGKVGGEVARLLHGAPGVTLRLVGRSLERLPALEGVEQAQAGFGDANACAAAFDGADALLLVSAGESVTKGQRVALVGGTGHVTGPHLHLELTCDGVYYNPEFYLA